LISNLTYKVDNEQSDKNTWRSIARSAGIKKCVRL